MPPLYLYIKVQSLQQQKKITPITMEKTPMHGAKESRNLIHGMKPSNAHSRVRKSLTKQNCFKKQHLERKLCHTAHTLITNKPASMEWGNHSSPTWNDWLTTHFNKAFVTSIFRVLTCIYWGEDLETPRLIEASSSSLLQLPSCEQGIQTKKELTKHELVGHWSYCN